MKRKHQGDDRGVARQAASRKRSRRQNKRSAIEWSEFTDALLESIPVRVFLKDTDGVMIACNSLVAKDFGLTKEEIIGKEFSSFATPELTADAARTDTEVLRTGKRLVYEPRERMAGGGYRYGVVTKSPYFNPDGTIAGVIAVLVDTTEVRLAEEQLRLSAAVFQHSYEGMYIADQRNRIVQVNPAFSTITGYSKEEAVGRSPRFLATDQERPEIFDEIWQTIQDDGVWNGELINRRRDGELFPVWATITAVRNEQGVNSHYIGIFHDISERKATEERLRWLAHHDFLTGLANRSLFEDRLEQALRRARRQQSTVALILLDLDHFKPVNDEFGHDVGDEVLKQVARRLVDSVRQTDTVARIGGDEFVVVASDVGTRKDVQSLAEKLLARVCRPVQCGAHSLSINASIGISIYPEHGAVPEALLKAADTAMYHIKGSGRSGYHIFIGTATTPRALR